MAKSKGNLSSHIVDITLAWIKDPELRGGGPSIKTGITYLDFSSHWKLTNWPDRHMCFAETRIQALHEPSVESIIGMGRMGKNGRSSRRRDVFEGRSTKAALIVDKS
jgi:hypothetical protein